MEGDTNNSKQPVAKNLRKSESTKVWVQLMREKATGGVETLGPPTTVAVQNNANIDDLKTAVKEHGSHSLREIDAFKLTVYPPGTRFDDSWNPKDGRTAYNPRKKVASLNFTSNKDDMEDDSEMEEDDTLIVVAPKVVYDSSHQVSFVFVVCIMLRVFCFSRLVLMVQYTLYFTFSMRLCSL